MCQSVSQCSLDSSEVKYLHWFSIRKCIILVSPAIRKIDHKAIRRKKWLSYDFDIASMLRWYISAILDIATISFRIVATINSSPEATFARAWGDYYSRPCAYWAQLAQRYCHKFESISFCLKKLSWQSFETIVARYCLTTDYRQKVRRNIASLSKS